MLESTLEPAVRLALAYAPAAVRPLQLAAFALDARLAGLVRDAREPMLAQLKLAWWRDRLRQDVADRPLGEPLLAALADWPGAAEPLLALVDGWEAMLDPEDGAAAIGLVAVARGRLGEGLALAAGTPAHTDQARQALHDWTLASLGHPDASAPDWQAPRLRLPRGLRSLAILHGLARRARGTGPLLDGSGALAVAVRIGMIGR